MNEFSAAIGRIQLKKLEKLNNRRKKIAKRYSDELKVEEKMKFSNDSAYHLFWIRVKSRDNLRKILLTQRIKKILNGKLKNKKITFLGVTFKPNTDDMREASSIPMIKYLNKNNSKIRYFDPSGEKKEFKKLKNVEFCKNIAEACLKSDLIILHTEWNDFKLLNFKNLVKKTNFKIYDMRNIYSPSKMKNLKIKYFGIGR